MRLTIEIQSTDKDDFYRVYDEYDSRNASICSTGWSIRDAVDDFVEEFNRLSFYDDDTPVLIGRDEIELKRIRYRIPRMF